MNTPPQRSQDISIVHKTKQLYTLLYRIAERLPKKDKLGIHQELQRTTLALLILFLKASFQEKLEKLPTLKEGRIITETIKHLVRIEAELKIISEKHYLDLEGLLQGISKMINGWIKYLQENPS